MTIFDFALYDSFYKQSYEVLHRFDILSAHDDRKNVLYATVCVYIAAERATSNNVSVVNVCIQAAQPPHCVIRIEMINAV